MNKQQELHACAVKLLALYRRMVSTYPAAAEPGLRQRLEMAVGLLANEEPPPGDFMEVFEKLVPQMEEMFAAAGFAGEGEL